ncbi:MAG: hypothetical protein WAX89_05900 [Alphaproteobacteria bacterium]
MFFKTYAVMVRDANGKIVACLSSAERKGDLSWEYADRWRKNGNTIAVEAERHFTPWFFAVECYGADIHLLPNGGWLGFDEAKRVAHIASHDPNTGVYVAAAEPMLSYYRKRLWQAIAPRKLREWQMNRRIARMA